LLLEGRVSYLLAPCCVCFVLHLLRQSICCRCQANLGHRNWPAAHNELNQLLGAHPDKALTQGLVRPSSSSSAGTSKKQQKQPAGSGDVWGLLDILDAANLLLWADLVRPGKQGVAAVALCRLCLCAKLR
jgi:hypothetical protein